jgi:hypothetical protein
MRSARGKLYLVDQLKSETGRVRLELADGSPVEHIEGPLYRLVATGEIVRIIGSD